jgi:hypothetical protein
LVSYACPYQCISDENYQVLDEDLDLAGSQVHELHEGEWMRYVVEREKDTDPRSRRKQVHYPTPYNSSMLKS